MMRSTRPRIHRLAAVALAATAVLASEPVARAAVAPPTPVPRPLAGDKIGPFQAPSVEGQSVKVDFPKGSKTVLLFFSSTCPTCHRMIPEWNKAFKEKPKGVQVYGIAVDKPGPAFFVMTEVDFPVLLSPSKEFLDTMKVYKVPTTVRVGPGGTVEDAAQGQIDRMRLGQFFAP